VEILKGFSSNCHIGGLGRHGLYVGRGCFYEIRIFIKILRGTGAMVIFIVHFSASVQVWDGQSSLDPGRLD